MRVLPILIVFTFLISCQGMKDKNHNDFVSKVETIGLDNFKNIGYGTRVDFEIYDYCLLNDSSVSWTYNRKSKQFEFPLVQQDFKKVAVDFPSYILDLRNKIQSLDIVMITQAPWCENIVGFWISSDEKIEYVNPEFKFDDRFKNEWLKEIKTGHKLKDNWYYIKIKK
jgi:hypothetical protein